MAHERALVAEALPHYEIGSEIGRGASGIVLAATHRRLGRPVAIKQLPRAYGADPYVKARFLHEARVLAELNHPHVVSIYDYCEHQGLCLLVMEHCGGGSLWDRQERGRPSPAWSIGAVLAMATALDAAHRKGILHRDVKPDNAVFSDGDILKVTDFGVAKSSQAPSGLTETGLVLGTPAYISPEQCSGRPLGPPTDVYALGVVLYELLAGELPFPDDGDPVAMLLRHAKEPPPPLRDRTAAPPAVSDTVMRALAKDPADRPPTALAFGLELARAAAAGFGPGWLDETDIEILGGGELQSAVRQPQRPWSTRTLGAEAIGAAQAGAEVAVAAAPKPASGRATQPAAGRRETAVDVAAQASALARLTDDGLPEVSAWLRSRVAGARSAEVVVALTGPPRSGASTLAEALAGTPEDQRTAGAATVAPVLLLAADGRLASVVRVLPPPADPLAAVRTPCDDIATFAGEDGNPSNIRGVEYVERPSPATSVPAGVSILDLPAPRGLGAAHHALALAAAAAGAAIVAVRRASDPVDDPAAVDAVAELASRTAVVWCLSRTDLVREWPLALDELRHAVRGRGATVPVHGVAARLSALADDSGVPDVAAWVARATTEARRARGRELAADVCWVVDLLDGTVGDGLSADVDAAGEVDGRIGRELSESAARVGSTLAAGMAERAGVWTSAAATLESLLDWDGLTATVQRETAEALVAAWRSLDERSAAARGGLGLSRPPAASTHGGPGPVSAPIGAPTGQLAARLGFLARVLTDVTAAVTATAPADLALAGDELSAERRAAELARRRTQAAAAVAAFAAALPAVAARRFADEAATQTAAIADEVRGRTAVVAAIVAGGSRPDADRRARAVALAAPLRPPAAAQAEAGPGSSAGSGASSAAVARPRP
jgi:hypothetical protein